MHIILSLVGFALNRKKITLNDLEWLFYVCDDKHFAHFADDISNVFIVSRALSSLYYQVNLP